MTSTPCYDINTLVPHEAPMMLLSGILERSDDYIVAYVDQDGNSLFAEEDGRVPAWVGIEYMAQTIAAFAGARLLDKNCAIRLGFLLGSRKYQADCAYFERGERLHIRAECEYLDDGGLALFQCSISRAGHIIASADIKAIQPDDVEAVLDNF